MSIDPLHSLGSARFEIPGILKALNAASRSLAELKGVVSTMPNQEILISTLSLQEAKDSSEIENIVTTHDELFRHNDPADGVDNAEAKEVLRYRAALNKGYDKVKATGLLTLNTVIEIQREIEPSKSGLRTRPGTVLQDASGRTVYVPPQSGDEVRELLGDLERFWHGQPRFDVDPLIRMALVHHQFESIHPFYDGNGRTGRVINVLLLVKEGLLDIPVLYLSRHILKTRSEYYRLLRAVHEDDRWEEWVEYMLLAVQQTAMETVSTILEIKALVQDFKHRIRDQHKFYSQDLINNLFSHPYTKIEFVQRDLNVSRLTATKYLDALAVSGFLLKRKIGRSNYYVNVQLFELLSRAGGA